MADINVNVNENKLANFSEFVKKFGKDTQRDCEILKDALRKLQRVSSREELSEIVDMVNRIDDIIIEEKLTIDMLAQKIDEYVEFVRRLKTAARS